MKKYLLISSLVINMVFLILLIYFLSSIHKNEKESFCRDIAHEAVFARLIHDSLLSKDSYSESYYEAYNNCVKYRKN